MGSSTPWSAPSVGQDHPGPAVQGAQEAPRPG